MSDETSPLKHSAQQAIYAYWLGLPRIIDLPYRSDVALDGFGTAAPYYFIGKLTDQNLMRIGSAGVHLNEILGFAAGGMVLNCFFTNSASPKLQNGIDMAYKTGAAQVLKTYRGHDESLRHNPPQENANGALLLCPLADHTGQPRFILGSLAIENGASVSQKRLSLSTPEPVEKSAKTLNYTQRTDGQNENGFAETQTPFSQSIKPRLRIISGGRTE